METRNIKIKIPKEANDLIHALQEGGYEAYVVGGCVRDSILNRPVHDWDICTSATPREMVEIFKDKRIIETGLKHGTITVLNGDGQYEITTFRTDGEYSDCRRPDNVTFVKNLREDLQRRDFTINAIAYNDEAGIVDPFDGLKDIDNQLIRCVGNPIDRFNEDGLRIMRAIRFAAQLDFCIENSTEVVISLLARNLNNISAERISSELKKIMTSTQPSIIMENEEVLKKIIPEFIPCIGFQQNNPYHYLTVEKHIWLSLIFSETDNLYVNLALLFHDIGKPECYTEDENGIGHFYGHPETSAKIADRIMRRLKFDNYTRESVVELIKYHDAEINPTPRNVKKWLNKIGEEQFRRLLWVKEADIKAQKYDYRDERIEKLHKIIDVLDEVTFDDTTCFSLKDLAINGNDVMRIIDIEPGREVGEWLNKALENIIEGKMKNNRTELITCLQERSNWLSGNKKEKNEEKMKY